MSYTINVTNHDTITINTGEIDQSTSLSLIGKNVPNYGQLIAQDLVSLMQNFAGTGEPNGPVTGQLWYDSSIGALNVCTGNPVTPFKRISSLFSSPTIPNSSLVGELWWDTTNSLLKLYNGSSWVAIGPTVLNTSSTFLSDVIIDVTNVNRSVLKIILDDIITGVITRESFTPKTTIPGFGSFNPGLNLVNNTVIPNNAFRGNVVGTTVTASTVSTNNATIANNTTANLITAASVVATTIGNSATSLVGTLATGSQTSITALGTLTNLTVTNTISGSVSGSAGTATKLTTARNINGVLFDGSADVTVPANAATLTGTTLSSGITQFGGTLTSLAVSGSITVNSGNNTQALINGGTNGVGNIGASGATFNTVFAKATTAQYADLAERYHSDAIYPAGTVVKIGGPNEITVCDEDSSTEVFGVISKNPAYLMNDNQTDPQWLPVVLVGRSIVNVVGTCSKGQYLVSGADGHARAATDSELVFNKVIGRSLVDKKAAAPAQIECYINTN